MKKLLLLTVTVLYSVLSSAPGVSNVQHIE
jgi:hypothetical protein